MDAPWWETGGQGGKRGEEEYMKRPTRNGTARAPSADGKLSIGLHLIIFPDAISSIGMNDVQNLFPLYINSIFCLFYVIFFSISTRILNKREREKEDNQMRKKSFWFNFLFWIRLAESKKENEKKVIIRQACIVA